MKRWLKWFWPPLVWLGIAGAVVSLAYWSVRQNVPVDRSAWQAQASQNATRQLQTKATIADVPTAKAAKAQTQATALQHRYGMGELTIPSQGIDLTIFSVVTDATLATGVARYFPQRSMGSGNNVYAAHNLIGDLLLRRISRLKHGDAIQQTDFKHVYHYQVVYNRVVKMTEVAVLAQTEEQRITLIRCEGPYHSSFRRVVIGRLTKITTYRKQNAQPEKRQAPWMRLGRQLVSHQNDGWLTLSLVLPFMVLLVTSAYGYSRH